MTLARFFHEDLQRIQQELKINAAPVSPQPLVIELSPMDLSELLCFVVCERIFYFSSKDQNINFLGLGIAQRFKKDEIHHFLTQYPEHFLSTDLYFEDESKSEFILHEWSFIQQGDNLHLVIFKNSENKMYSAPALLLDEHFPVVEQNFSPPWKSYEEVPEHDEWFTMIEKAHGLLQTGELEKIVLSRKKIFGYGEVLDAISFFKNLLQKNDKAKSYRIFHQPRFGEAFLSITPEKLFSLRGRNFESISLAGSAPRGKNDTEDLMLENHLRSDKKLFHEHSLVTEELKKKLEPISEQLNVGELVTMKLPYIQHRQADIQARLKKETSAIELLDLLHPTPAIGGLPWHRARVRLPEIELNKRGHYAAPIGILSAHLTEFAVGIRSALIEADKITLFGGAGIVKGSIAEEEWIETGTKMNPFLKVINNE